MIGHVQIGHDNHVVIQSMTNTKTANVVATLKQINELVKQGCELVRVAILDEQDLNALSKITKKTPCPIIADIHYNYQFAIKAILAGAKKIRINPGNISNKVQLKQIVETAKKHKVAIRIGFNTGS
jgi:(E)-4-hydroxy-3-methylbut-2-enyl-diphosphate synthase